QRGRPVQYPRQRLLDQRLGVYVQRRQRIVEHQYPGLPEHRAGQGESLPLPAGQRQSLFADPGIQAPRQVVHELGLGHGERLRDLLVGGVGRPRVRFSRTDMENSVASSKATPMTARRLSSVRSRMPLPSRVIRPPETSWSRCTSETSEVFPDPVTPTIATVSPGSTSRSIRRSTGSPASANPYASASQHSAPP